MGRMSHASHEHKKDKVPRSPALLKKPTVSTSAVDYLTLISEDPEIFVKVELSKINYMETLM